MVVNRQEDRPLVIMDASGGIVDVTRMNRKAFTKSTEHGELWVVHEETERVLPYEGRERRFSSLDEHPRWFRAVLVSVTASDAAGGRAVPQSAPGANGPPKAQPPAATTRSDAGRILADLAAVIERRKTERPEGSYTAYLFDAGEEKIRKKTGEEAIELLLARSRGEVVSESADLIYHLMVLLNQLEIPLGEVLAELEERA